MKQNDNIKHINDNIKHIIVTNGTGRSGKDTFAKMINKLVPSYKVSSIDFVKELFAPYFNDYLLEQGKTESYRKLLADTKHDIIAFSPCFFANLMFLILCYLHQCLILMVLVYQILLQLM